MYGNLVMTKFDISTISEIESVLNFQKVFEGEGGGGYAVADVTITDKELKNVNLCLALSTLKQEEVFVLTQFPWMNSI